MLPPGGTAPKTIAVVWLLVTFCLAAVLMRLYARMKVLNIYGLDDHLFNAAFLFLVLSASCTTAASCYGFGHKVAEIDIPNYTKANLLMECTQTAICLATLLSKTSIAIFLYRLGETRSQKAAIIVPVILSVLSFLGAMIGSWLSCSPVAYCWDPTIPNGVIVDWGYPVITAAFAIVIVVDFWYAAFPWYILRKVQMPVREKRMIQISLSLGSVAALFGIVRATTIYTIFTDNWLEDAWIFIVWTFAEATTSVVCIGIAVCRPLWKTWLSDMTDRVSYRISNRPSGAVQRFDVKRRTPIIAAAGGGLFSHKKSAPSGSTFHSNHRQSDNAQPHRTPRYSFHNNPRRSALFRGSRHSALINNTRNSALLSDAASDEFVILHGIEPTPSLGEYDRTNSVQFHVATPIQLKKIIGLTSQEVKSP